jgi:hypothetical protein
MASDTKNVKLGVCKVIYDGKDLGYTSGGVEVSVKTDTHKVMVDQFGKTPINEYIMGREVTAKVPLAETTLENMVAIMPGTTLVTTGGAKAAGSITIDVNPADGETIVVNGATVTFKTVAAGALDVTIGATAAATAANLKAMLDASTNQAIALADYAVAGSVVTVTAVDKGTAGNAFTLDDGTAGANVTLSGATLSGGTEPTAKSVATTTGIGTNLLEIAKELRFHPKGKPDSDVSDDFVIVRAATAGALKFAYKLEDERIYDTEFMGYPDPVSEKLFTIGV